MSQSAHHIHVTTPENERSRPRFSVVQAAARTGVARSTIQRRLKKGDFPGAYQLPDGTWSIGVDDLLAAGLRVDAPTPADDLEHGHADAARIASLEAALAAANARAEAAERVAAERNRIIEAQDRALRMLTAGKGMPDTHTPEPPAPARSRGLLERVAGRLGI